MVYKSVQCAVRARLHAEGLGSVSLCRSALCACTGMQQRGSAWLLVGEQGSVSALCACTCMAAGGRAGQQPIACRANAAQHVPAQLGAHVGTAGRQRSQYVIHQCLCPCMLCMAAGGMDCTQGPSCDITPAPPLPGASATACLQLD